MSVCRRCGKDKHSWAHFDACVAKPPYRLCALCGVVWNADTDVCPPNLRSEHEDRMLDELRKKAG